MKVLVPLDGSEFAEAALKPVAGLVGPSGAEVHLIQIVAPAEAMVDWSRHSSVEPHATGDLGAPEYLRGALSGAVGAIPVESSGQAGERLRMDAKDYLIGISHRFFSNRAISVAVTGNSPSAEIREYAINQSIDLIAIATHGRTGLARMMMGSVAADLLKDYVSPVLMVRPDGLK